MSKPIYARKEYKLLLFTMQQIKWQSWPFMGNKKDLYNAQVDKTYKIKT